MCLRVHVLVCSRVHVHVLGYICEYTRVGVRVCACVYSCVCVFQMLGEEVFRERDRGREKERDRERDRISVKLRVYNECNLHLDDIICGHP
jgi:hypothetical protein